jgi:hypothetical protein
MCGDEIVLMKRLGEIIVIHDTVDKNRCQTVGIINNENKIENSILLLCRYVRQAKCTRAKS